jgi:hypothetical protein
MAASGLPEDRFLDLLHLVASGVLGLHYSSLKDAELRPVFDDLLVAGEMIAARERVDDDRPEVDGVLDALTGFATRYEDYGDFDFCFACAELAGRSKSFRTAMRFLGFALWCQRVPDLDYPIDHLRCGAVYGARCAVISIAPAHGEAIESRLIEAFHRHTLAERNVLAGIMAAVGSRRSLRVLVDYVRAADFRFEHEWDVDGFWHSVFSLIRRHGFAPDMIDTLNGALGTRFHDAKVMVGYHRSLRELAERIRTDEGRGLFEILEPRGMQFWDYWLTYRA